MIRPISIADNRKINFKGKIQESVILNKALGKLKPIERAEFNDLKTKAAKVQDGKIFSLCIGCKYSTNKKTGEDEHYYYTQLHESNEKKFFPAEIYKISTAYRRSIFEDCNEKIIATDDSAFARAILNPLREIYNK